ncbi:C-terminal binding protein [Candidatus Poribacteria bacterium]|nr:C-terminal binding protein [Candidatus Poribacteria bacterium]
MRKFKVVVFPCDYEVLDIEREVLEPIGAEVVRVDSWDERDLIETARDADAVLVQYTRIDDRILSKLERCKVMVRYGTGYDNFDLEAMTRHGVYAAYVPDYCVDEVSSHTLALLLALERKIVRYNDDVRAGIWSSHRERPIYRTKDQTLGIIGLGRIGRAFCLKAKPIFGQIVACDPYIPDSVFDEYGARKVDLDELLDISDAISLHVPLIRKPTGVYRSTYHLIGEREIKLMKPNAYIVNTARGPVVDNAALCQALREGRIAGAALDVLEDEPLTENGSSVAERFKDLLESGRLIITPHSAYLSEKSLRDVRRMAAEEVTRVLRGETPKAWLNPHSSFRSL